MVTTFETLNVKLFADGADTNGIKNMANDSRIKGFTTNPTLMRKAGVKDYKQFGLEVLSIVKDRPVSFEVFADEFIEMERQAMEIASWGKNVNVKIPVTTTKGEMCTALVSRLSKRGVHVNVTAIMTIGQVKKIADVLDSSTAAYLSIFAGRIADTGVDPVPLMAEAVKILATNSKAELIWASPRELLNIFQANAVGCHIITATHDILNKLPLVGKNLESFSLETVKMFFNDAQTVGYAIPIPDELVA